MGALAKASSGDRLGNRSPPRELLWITRLCHVARRTLTPSPIFCSGGLGQGVKRAREPGNCPFRLEQIREGKAV